jgi:hypothetical protein
MQLERAKSIEFSEEGFDWGSNFSDSATSIGRHNQDVLLWGKVKLLDNEASIKLQDPKIESSLTIPVSETYLIPEINDLSPCVTPRARECVEAIDQLSHSRGQLESGLLDTPAGHLDEAEFDTRMSRANSIDDSQDLNNGQEKTIEISPVIDTNGGSMVTLPQSSNSVSIAKKWKLLVDELLKLSPIAIASNTTKQAAALLQQIAIKMGCFFFVGLSNGPPGCSDNDIGVGDDTLTWEEFVMLQQVCVIDIILV